MRKLILPLLLASACLASCGGGPPAYEISFFQDGQEVRPDGDRLMLEKAPFTVRLRLNRPTGVFLNFQPGDRVYRRANNGEELYEPGYAMAEHNLNPEKNFLITPDTYHYWYYASDAEHRFSRVRRKGGWYECERDIENYGLQGEAGNHPIKKLPHGRLYLVAYITVKAGDAWKTSGIKAFRLVFS